MRSREAHTTFLNNRITQDNVYDKEGNGYSEDGMVPKPIIPYQASEASSQLLFQSSCKGALKVMVTNTTPPAMGPRSRPQVTTMPI